MSLKAMTGASRVSSFDELILVSEKRDRCAVLISNDVISGAKTRTPTQPTTRYKESVSDANIRVSSDDI